MSSTRAIKSLKRAFRTGLDDLLYLASVVVIVILVNAFLRGEGSLRVDLTEEGLYTLTPSTEDFVRDLPGKIQIKAFFSEGLQAPDHNLAQRVEDVLVDFEAASEGKLSYEIIFPDEESEEDEELAKGFGIEKVAIGHRDKNQVGLRLVYKGIAFVYGDKQEVINDVNASDLEYQITKALKNLVKTKDHKIGVLQGFGGPGADPQFLPSLQQAFESVYGGLILAEGVDLSTQDAIPSDIDALLILNVQEAVSAQAKMAIDQFLMQGKSVALFQSPSAADPRMQQLPFRMPIEHGLDELFEKYGVRLKQDLVLDREKNMVGLEFTSQGIAEVSIPTLPMLTGINRENILTKNLDAMVLPFSGSLELTEEALNASELRVSKLIESADSAVSRPAMGDLKLESLMTPSEDEQAGPLLLAVSLD
ncbi:MAG: GldG family protein, partial [Myxococcota bacterium]|nr:GldG family protein [Myxococcota bacterium]